jgi:nucleotide-binding universal stress UspA family protein
LSFATLMVCMRVGRSNAGLLAVARDVAARFGSAVIGIAAKQVFSHAAAIRGAGPCEPHQHDLRKFAEHAAAAEDEFRKALANGDKLEWRTRMTFGPTYEHIGKEARVADLVMATIDGRDRFFAPSGQAEIGDLLKSAGRPVLAAPPEATGLGFGQALVFWKETRETRRAVADALPLLKAMKHVDVVEIVEAPAIEESRRRLGDVRDWLARHGVEANCSAEVSRGSDCARLTAMAEDLRADLVVAGAFSHGRLHEWAFGDTRDLLSRIGRCVLASR